MSPLTELLYCSTYPHSRYLYIGEDEEEGRKKGKRGSEVKLGPPPLSEGETLKEGSFKPVATEIR